MSNFRIGMGVHVHGTCVCTCVYTPMYIDKHCLSIWHDVNQNRLPLLHYNHYVNFNIIIIINIHVHVAVVINFHIMRLSTIILLLKLLTQFSHKNVTDLGNCNILKIPSKLSFCYTCINFSIYTVRVTFAKYMYEHKQ